MVDRSIGRKAFRTFNAAFFILYALLCLLPMINVLAMSFSSANAVSGGKVTLLPVEFTLKSYQTMLTKDEYWRAMGVSFMRIILGVSLSMLMNILASYPLSKNKATFRPQAVFAWLFVFTMLFGGGLIPSFMIVKYTGLIDKIWALVIPGSVSVFNVLLLMNFFRNVPKDLEESAFIDGAGHWRILFTIYLPVSLPALATLMVFNIVGHWNSWFDGLIYMNSPQNYPVQSYMYTILSSMNVRVMTKAQAALMRMVSDRTLKAAQVFIAAIPVLLIYPFLQRYFITGIMLGSLKE